MHTQVLKDYNYSHFWHVSVQLDPPQVDFT
jgi:hypothetical protein